MTRPPAMNRAAQWVAGASVIGALNEFRTGSALLLRGVRFLLQRPRLAMLGMIPPLLVGTVMVALLLALALFGLAPLTAMLTGWVPEPVVGLARVIAAVVIMIGAGVIAVVLFATVTMALGGPIYERISLAVEAEVGLFTGAAPEPAWRSLLRGVGQGLVVIAISALGGVVVFLIGLIPILGGPIAVVAGAVLAGGLIAVELTSGVFDRRGRRPLALKIAALRRRRWLTWGFGVTVFVIFSIPLMSVIAFPAATAGAAMLALEVE